MLVARRHPVTQSLASTHVSQLLPPPGELLAARWQVVTLFWRRPDTEGVGTDLLKGRPDNCDQRASQSTATIKLEYKT